MARGSRRPFERSVPEPSKVATGPFNRGVAAITLQMVRDEPSSRCDSRRSAGSRLPLGC